MPEVIWLFFEAGAKRQYLSHTGRAGNVDKQPTGTGPKGWDENGPAAALLVGHVSIQRRLRESSAASGKVFSRGFRLLGAKIAR